MPHRGVSDHRDEPRGGRPRRRQHYHHHCAYCELQPQRHSADLPALGPFGHGGPDAEWPQIHLRVALQVVPCGTAPPPRTSGKARQRPPSVLIHCVVHDLVTRCAVIVVAAAGALNPARGRRAELATAARGRGATRTARRNHGARAAVAASVGVAAVRGERCAGAIACVAYELLARRLARHGIVGIVVTAADAVTTDRCWHAEHAPAVRGRDTTRAARRDRDARAAVAASVDASVGGERSAEATTRVAHEPLARRAVIVVAAADAVTSARCWRDEHAPAVRDRDAPRAARCGCDARTAAAGLVAVVAIRGERHAEATTRVALEPLARRSVTVAASAGAVTSARCWRAEPAAAVRDRDATRAARCGRFARTAAAGSVAVVVVQGERSVGATTRVAHEPLAR